MSALYGLVIGIIQKYRQGNCREETRRAYKFLFLSTRGLLGSQAGNEKKSWF